MKRSLIVVLLFLASVTGIYAQEPEKGDIGALLMSTFTNEEEAMRFVVRDILFPMNIIPDTYDKDLGYIVTERFYYAGWLNCQFVMFFKETSEGVAIKIIGRDYNSDRGEGMHSGPMTYTKGMDGSPVDLYWKYMRAIVKKIPHKSLDYISR